MKKITENTKIKKSEKEILENEIEIFDSQIKALYSKRGEKIDQLNQILAEESSDEFRKFFENGAGKYIKVHYAVKDEYEDYEIDKYYVGLLGALTSSKTAPTFEKGSDELVAPIKDCVNVDARYGIIEKESYFEITEDIFENSDEYSFEFITKEEANQFILDNIPQF